MGADNVVVCYGLRYSLGQDGELSDEDLAAYEQNTEPRVVAARKVGLKVYFGKVTDGGEYFLLIGWLLGTFGVEGSVDATIPDAALAEAMQATRERLARAGLHGEPALHVQLEAQY